MSLSKQSILFRVNGIDFKNFKDINLRKSLVEFCGGYNITYTDREGNAKRFTAGDLIEIIVNGESYIKGYISDNSGSISVTSHDITSSGYERTIDIEQSSLTTNIEFQSSVKMVDVIKKVLESLEITGVKVISNLDIKPFEGDEIVSGEMGDKAFEFIEKYARKRQLMVTTNRDGNIELQRSNQVYSGAVLQLLNDNPTNNIKTSSFSENLDNRFHQYTCKCSDNLSSGTLSEDFSDRVGIAIDKQIRKSRKLEIIMDSSSLDTLKKRAIWEKNVRLNSGIYKCTVQGFSANNGKLYYPNNGLLQVNDEVWGINKQMLLRDVDMSFSNGGGSLTQLTLVDPVAFSTIEDYKYNFSEGSIIRR